MLNAERRIDKRDLCAYAKADYDKPERNTTVRW